jgi:hypothetical protein
MEKKRRKIGVPGGYYRKVDVPADEQLKKNAGYIKTFNALKNLGTYSRDQYNQMHQDYDDQSNPIMSADARAFRNLMAGGYPGLPPVIDMASVGTVDYRHLKDPETGMPGLMTNPLIYNAYQFVPTSKKSRKPLAKLAPLKDVKAPKRIVTKRELPGYKKHKAKRFKRSKKTLHGG